MTQITLSSDQAQIVLQARDQIRICDPSGNVLGVMAAAVKDEPNSRDFTDEEIETAIRSRDNPGTLRTTKEVLQLLRSIRPDGG